MPAFQYLVEQVTDVVTHDLANAEGMPAPPIGDAVNKQTKAPLYGRVIHIAVYFEQLRQAEDSDIRVNGEGGSLNQDISGWNGQQRTERGTPVRSRGPSSAIRSRRPKRTGGRYFLNCPVPRSFGY